MSNSGHSSLRVGAYLLSDAEANLLRALLRLFNYDDKSRWVFAEEAPFDALVVDNARAQVVSAASLPRATRILRLVDNGDSLAGTVDVLERPIRSNRFESWLSQVAGELGSASAVIDMQPKAPSEAPARAKVVTDSDRSKSFKLRRWPPAAVLRNDGQRIRIATLLSRRALSLSQLVRLAGQAEDDVMLFLRVMQSAQLLDVADYAATPPGSNPGAARRTLDHEASHQWLAAHSRGLRLPATYSPEHSQAIQQI